MFKSYIKNRSRIIHAFTCKDPLVLHFLNISAFSCVYPQELTTKISACSCVWDSIMHFTLFDFHACIREYSLLCDACTCMSACGNTCVYTHPIPRIYMRFYENHVWLGMHYWINDQKWVILWVSFCFKKSMRITWK